MDKTTALRDALCAMKIANALPGVNREYDFTAAIRSVESALKTTPPIPADVVKRAADNILDDWFAERHKADPEFLAEAKRRIARAVLSTASGLLSSPPSSAPAEGILASDPSNDRAAAEYLSATLDSEIELNDLLISEVEAMRPGLEAAAKWHESRIEVHAKRAENSYLNSTKAACGAAINFHRESAEAIRAIPSGAGEGWQPIETAPKDGTRFLAWQNKTDGWFECWWHQVHGTGDAYWMDASDSEPDPKFWLPHPGTPSPQRGEK